MKVFLCSLAVLAALAAAAVPAEAATPIVPSQTQAIHDAKVEILHHYINLLIVTRPAGAELMPNAQVGCTPLSDTLYRCTWLGKSRFYTVLGNAKVRFYKYATDVTLYNVKCYRGVSGVDYCSSAGTPPVG